VPSSTASSNRSALGHVGARDRIDVIDGAPSLESSVGVSPVGESSAGASESVSFGAVSRLPAVVVSVSTSASPSASSLLSVAATASSST